MQMPFRRAKSLPARLLHAIAAGAGIARLALRQRTLRPRLPKRNGGNRLTRAWERTSALMRSRA
jgi:hypothetical protein